MAALRHAIRPVVRVWVVVGRARVLPGWRRTEPAANRRAPHADARRRHRRFACSHDSRGSDRTPPHADGGCGAHGSCGARLRMDEESLAPGSRGNRWRHQPERSGSGAVSAD